MHKRVNPRIIREYDIRGKVPQELDDSQAYNIGYLLGKEILSRYPYKSTIKIAVGRDDRPSSAQLHKSFVAGLVDILQDKLLVIDLESVPTPLVYFASHYYPDVQGAIMITGSHNPLEYNGYKIVINKCCLSGEELDRIFSDKIRDVQHIPAPHLTYNMFFDNVELALHDSAADKSYGTKRVDIAPLYQQFIESVLELPKGIFDNLRIAWDCNLGPTAKLLRRWHKKLAGEHIIVDHKLRRASNDNYSPDPTKLENLSYVSWVVRRQKCHIGFAFDGDGDRLVMLNSRGQVIRHEMLLWFLCYLVIEENPGGTIVLDSKVSPRIVQAIKQIGGEVVLWKTGHSLIKKKMSEVGAVFAGELSGHFFFGPPHYYGYDDPIYAAFKILKVLVDDNNRLPLHRAQKYSVLGNKLTHIASFLQPPAHRMHLKFECSRQYGLFFTAMLLNVMRELGLNYSSLDGVRYEDKLGWWIIRSSNTEDIIMLIGEVYEEDAIKAFLSNLLDLCAAAASTKGLTECIPFAEGLRKDIEMVTKASKNLF